MLANELLDNLPFDLVEARGGAWHPVLVDVDASGLLVERLGDPVDPDHHGGDAAVDGSARVDDPTRWHVVVDASSVADGARLPVQRVASAFVRDALAVLDQGVMIIVDYAASARSLASRPWTDWVRTYREHQPGGHPLDHLGRQDITCEVALDPLLALAEPAELTTQAAFLAAHGMDALVAEGRAAWHEGAARGDLAALRARSRVREADALADPAGLGGFAVVRWLR